MQSQVTPKWAAFPAPQPPLPPQAWPLFPEGFTRRKLVRKENWGKLSIVVYIYNPSYSGGQGRRILSLRTAQARVARPIWRQ
jgi:hypothetical protein